MTPWPVAHEGLLSMEFPRQDCWSGLLVHSPGVFPKPRIQPRSPALQADSLASEPSWWSLLCVYSREIFSYCKEKCPTVFIAALLTCKIIHLFFYS